MFEAVVGFLSGWFVCELYINWKYRVIKKD